MKGQPIKFKSVALQIYRHTKYASSSFWSTNLVLQMILCSFWWGGRYYLL